MNPQILKHRRWIVGSVGGLVGVFSLLLGAALSSPPPESLVKQHTQLVAAIPLTHGVSNQPVQHKPDVLQIRRKARSQRTPKIISSRGADLLDMVSTPWQPFVATWYSPQGGVGDGMTTATGLKVKDDWTAAVDPNVVPLGSLIEIRFPDGHTHVYQAMDTGGAIVGRRVDIYNASEAACRQNGVQRVEVRIIHGGH